MARVKRKPPPTPSSWDKTFDVRDVYIMKRTTKKSWYAIGTMQSEYKIGIAKNTIQRNQTVDRAIRGNIKVLRSRRIAFARSIEKKLHRLFSDSRFKMKSYKKGGGDTEWFYMTPLEYAVLEFWLWWYSIRFQVWFFIVCLFIIYYAYLITAK